MGPARDEPHGTEAAFDEQQAPDASHPASGDSPTDPTRTDAYDYELPEGRIARYPAERRDESRLLVVPRCGEGGARHARPEGVSGAEAGRPAFRHLRFSDLTALLAPGDVLVLNESRVLPVRLLGRKPTGAECEVLLLRPVEGPAPGSQPDGGGSPRGASSYWEALVRPGSKLAPGRRVVVSDDPAAGLEVAIVDTLPGGGRLVRLDSPVPATEAIERFGRVPLPPYLQREAEPLDRERYQTVYAREPGSVAAPTAGLHFTPELLAGIEARGIEIARVVLHVGPGTFRPVKAERIEEHEMHRERWEVPAAAAAAIARARERGGRVWAVGTTVVRTLESAAGAARGGGETGAVLVRAGAGETRLFIAPGYRFRVVDALVTNFHLPRSTLLMLVSAFAGHATTMAAYEEAIREGYRFYSYGDAMAVVP